MYIWIPCKRQMTRIYLICLLSSIGICFELIPLWPRLPQRSPAATTQRQYWHWTFWRHTATICQTAILRTVAINPWLHWDLYRNQRPSSDPSSLWRLNLIISLFSSTDEWQHWLPLELFHWEAGECGRKAFRSKDTLIKFIPLSDVSVRFMVYRGDYHCTSWQTYLDGNAG